MALDSTSKLHHLPLTEVIKWAMIGDGSLWPIPTCSPSLVCLNKVLLTHRHSSVPMLVLAAFMLHLQIELLCETVELRCLWSARLATEAGMRSRGVIQLAEYLSSMCKALE